MNTLFARHFKSYFVESRFISLVVSVVVILLRLLLFLRKGLPEFQTGGGHFIWPYIESAFQPYPVVSFLASTLCIFIISYLISELNIRYGVIRMRSSMPYYLPLILFSVHPFFLRMTPDFPALIFILWSLFPLLASYQFHHSHRFAFQFSALITIAGIFQMYALLLLPLWLVGLSTLGGINVKSFMASAFGVIMVFWIVFAMYVFGDNIAGFIEPFKRFAVIYDFNQMPGFSVPQWGFIVTALLLVFAILIADGKYIARDRSFTKKVILFFLSVMVASILLQILYLHQTLFWIYLIVSFFSFVAAHFYTNCFSRTDILSFYFLLILFTSYFCLNFFTDLSPF